MLLGILMTVTEPAELLEYGKIISPDEARIAIAGVPLTNGLGSAFLEAYEAHAGWPFTAVRYRTEGICMDYIIGKCQNNVSFELTLWGGVVDASFMCPEPRLGIGINFHENDINFKPRKPFSLLSLIGLEPSPVKKFPLQARTYEAEIRPVGSWEKPKIDTEVSGYILDDLTMMIAHNIECLRRDK